MKRRTRDAPLDAIESALGELEERIQELGTAAPHAMESGDDANHSAVDLEDGLEALRRRLAAIRSGDGSRGDLARAVDELRHDVEAAFARTAVPAHDPRPG